MLILSVMCFILVAGKALATPVARRVFCAGTKGARRLAVGTGVVTDFNDPYNDQCDRVVHFLQSTDLHGLLRSGDCRLLELGCGSGPFGRRLLAEYPLLRVAGVDIMDKRIENLRRCVERDGLESRYRPLTGDIRCADLFSPGEFDVVLAPSVLHHILKLAKTSVPDNIGAWLRPGGYLLIFDPNGANPVLQLSNVVMRVAVRFSQSLHKYKVPDETMYPPSLFRSVFSNVGFNYMRGETCGTCLPVRRAKPRLAAVRNALFNVAHPVLSGERRGHELIALFQKPV